MLVLLASFASAAPAPVLVPQLGHSERVTGAVYTGDGRFLVTSGRDDTVRVWERSTGVLVRVLECFQRGVSCVAVAPDGWLVASGGLDGTVRLWDIAEGMPLRRLGKEGSPAVRAVAFAQDGQRVVVGTAAAVWSWDVRGGVLLHSAPLTGVELRSLAVSPRGDTVAVGVQGTKMRPLAVELRELEGLALSRGLTASQAPPHGHLPRPATADAVAFSPEGRWLAAGTHDGRVEVWDAESTTPRLSIDAAGAVRAVTFSPDGSLIAAAGGDVGLWAMRDGNGEGRAQPDFPERAGPATLGRNGVLRRDRGTGGPVDALAFAPDGRSYAAGRADGRVEIRSTDTAVLERALLPSTLFHLRPVVFTDGTLAAVGQASRGGTGVAWSGRDGMCRLEGNGPWTALAAAPGVVVGGTDTGLVESWRPTDGGRVWGASHQGGKVTSIAVAGSLVASGGDDRSIHIRRAQDGGLVRSLLGLTAWPTALALTRDATLLAEGGWDRRIHLWDPAAGKSLLSLEAPDSVNALALSDDGRSVAAACGGGDRPGSVAVWTLRSGAPPRLAECGDLPAAAIAVSHDAEIVTAGGGDGVLRIWAGADLAPVHEVPAHGSGVAAVALSSDGGWVVSAGRDGSARLWEAATGRLRLTLIVGLRDGVPRWLAWDPAGHYTGSDGVEGLLRWTVEAASLPGETFHERFHRPTVRVLLESGYTDR